MKLVIYNRDFTDRVQPELNVEFNTMSFERMGGCKELRATITGKDESLLSMINDLRCPVEVYDDNGTPVWWGYVYEVKLNRNGVCYGNSLDRLYNRARVDYYEPDSTTLNNTDFAENSASVSNYGYREVIATMNDVNLTTAELKRTAILNNFSNPTANYAISGDNNDQVDIICRGWSYTLKWQFVDSAPPVIGVEYDELGSVGDDVDDAVYQQFTVPAGSNQTMREVAIYANMYADDGESYPEDNLLVRIYALSGGAPTGAALATATIAPSALTGYDGVYAPTEAERIVAEFASPVELTAGTQYALHLSRSDGPQYANSYFVVNANSALGYSGGVYRYWDAGVPGWAVKSPDVDLVFALYSDEWTGVARQIKQVISEYAQFITGIADLSGCLDSEVPKFYPGNTTAWEVLSTYFEMGGTNGRELIVNIDNQRRLAIDEEPASTDGATYLLGSDGALITKSDTEVELSDLWVVAGQYVKLREDQFAELSAVSQAIIEEVQWSDSYGIRVILKGQIRIEDLVL